MVAFLGELEGPHRLVEGRLVGEGPSIDSRHHHVPGVTPPVGAGNAAQLERVAGDDRGSVHVRAVAHVEEGAVAIEGETLQAFVLHQLLGVLPLVGLSHFVESPERFPNRHLLPVEALPLLQNPAHALLKLGKVLFGEWLAEKEVVVEAIRDGRTETQRGTLAHVQHRLGHHVGETVPNAIEVVCGAFC